MPSAARQWGPANAAVRLQALYPADEAHQWLVGWMQSASDIFGPDLHLCLYDFNTDEGRQAGERLGIPQGGVLVNGSLGYRLQGRTVWLLGRAGHGGWILDDLFAIVEAEIRRAKSSSASVRPTDPSPIAASEKPEHELMMFCGAGLRQPIEAIRKEFEKERGVSIRVIYGGSACLLAQITMTHRQHPSDLFLPGEDYFAEQARSRGYVASSQTLCYFIPVIMTRKGLSPPISRLSDLTRPGLRVGLGEPKTCAVGKSTQDLLAKHRLRELLVPNVVMHAATAPELGNAIKVGSIDAAINWDAVAAWYEDSAAIIPIAPDENIVVACPLCVLGFAPHKPQADEFVRWAASEKGQAVFRKQRYTIAPDQPIFPYGLPATARQAVESAP